MGSLHRLAAFYPNLPRQQYEWQEPRIYGALPELLCLLPQLPQRRHHL